MENCRGDSILFSYTLNIMQSVLRQIHGLVHKWVLHRLRSLSIYCFFSFTWGQPVVAYVFFFFLFSCSSFFSFSSFFSSSSSSPSSPPLLLLLLLLLLIFLLFLLLLLLLLFLFQLLFLLPVSFIFHLMTCFRKHFVTSDVTNQACLYQQALCTHIYPSLITVYLFRTGDTFVTASSSY